jgi:predicted enzyme related to lactoylglutathione lyase
MEFRVVRVTDRFDDACRFYGDVLGWPVTREWLEGGRGRVFGYGDVGRVELMEGTPTPVSGVFMSIQTDDVASLRDRLLAHDVTIVQPLTDQPWGHRNIGIVDPTGITLVFFQPLDLPAQPDVGSQQIA